MNFFFQLVVTGLSLGMMYALIAIGFVIIFKCSKAFNIAQGQIVMMGGYLGYTFLVSLRLPRLGGHHRRHRRAVCWVWSSSASLCARCWASPRSPSS